MIKGIDVSHNNGTPQWDKVKEDAGFAMIRASYGWDNDKQIDKQLAANTAGCLAAGLPFGLYHYSYAQTPEDAQKEARFFLRVIGGLKPTYPVAFDFEEKSQIALVPEKQLAIIEAFLDTVQAAGYLGMLYMSASPLSALYRYAPERIKKYDIWVAHVDVAKPAFPGDYGIWQCSWKGSVHGITGDVDLNCAYKDYPAIIQAAGQNGWDQKPPSGGDTVAKAEYDALLARYEELSHSYASLRSGLSQLLAQYPEKA